MQKVSLLINGALLLYPFIGTKAEKTMYDDEDRKNVLFIVCDDLRPELNCYGQTHIKSPYIDSLANVGTVFDRAYCNIAVSGASRASLLTGLRPTKRCFAAWNARVDVDAPNTVTLNRYFKEAGYITIANGKIYHHQDDSEMKYWDSVMKPEHDTPMGYHTDVNLKQMELKESNPKEKRGYYYEYSNTDESNFLDWKIAEKSINDLYELSKSKKPFLLAVGFIRPHLPFIVPRKYWDMYEHDKIKIPENYVLTGDSNIPRLALNNWSELRQYSGIPSSGPMDEETAKMMIHGYYASVSFVDRQIGRVLEALKKTGLDKNTTIVLIGDHGWSLGEHGLWCKHSIFNTCLNATMIIKSPSQEKSRRCGEIVEFVDLYPTMCDAAGLKKPEHLEGKSLLPFIENGESCSKGYAVCRWANGFTLIKDNYFYTEWRDKNDKILDRMLFDHSIDKSENHNISNVGSNKILIDKLSKFLVKHRGEHYFE